MDFSVGGYALEWGGTQIKQNCIAAAEEIGCKMASAARVAQQLGTAAPPKKQCADVNRDAFALAQSLLRKTATGNATLARYAKRGRPMCFADDKSVFENIGPLFVKTKLSAADNGTCLVVTSVTDYTELDGKIYPGVHYCKLLPPARAIDYMMTDALKPTSGCLNT